MPWKYASKDTDKPTTRCEYCHKAYISKKYLKNHLMSKHICPVCPERFMGRNDLSNHMKTHSQCEACKDWFVTYEKMFKHQAKKHYQCPKCLMFFNSLEETHKHIDCSSNRPKHKCDQCDKEYLNKNSIYQHKQIHKGINIKCNICNKIFNNTDSYRRHINFHEKKLPQCMICKRYFSRRSALNDHIKRCNKHYCYYCHLDFTGKNNKVRYNEHMQSHKGNRKIKISINKKLKAVVEDGKNIDST